MTVHCNWHLLNDARFLDLPSGLYGKVSACLKLEGDALGEWKVGYGKAAVRTSPPPRTLTAPRSTYANIIAASSVHIEPTCSRRYIPRTPRQPIALLRRRRKKMLAASPSRLGPFRVTGWGPNRSDKALSAMLCSGCKVQCLVCGTWVTGLPQMRRRQHNALTCVYCASIQQ